MEKHCPYCKNNFEVKDGRIFSNHIRWCIENPKYDEIKKSTSKNISKTHIKKFKGLYELNPDKCINCSNNIKYEDHVRDRIYCNNKICRKIAKSRGSNKMSELSKQQVSFICNNCNKEAKKGYFKKDTICIACKEEFQQKEKSILENVRIKNLEKLSCYRLACNFKFKLSDFPNEFDFSLIEEHGWYSPSNKKNNLNGISRDHMVSIKYGFENKIDPKIISHPANCRLVKHTDNISKNLKCSISYDELIKRIEIWDQKYNHI